MTEPAAARRPARPPVDPLWRIAALAWAVLWGVSLFLPTAFVLGRAVPGWKVLATGGFENLQFFVMWLANPVALAIAAFVASGRRPWPRIGVLCGLLALSSLKWLWPYAGVGIGFWVWLASFSPLVLADLWIALRGLRRPFG